MKKLLRVFLVVAFVLAQTSGSVLVLAQGNPNQNSQRTFCHVENGQGQVITAHVNEWNAHNNDNHGDFEILSPEDQVTCESLVAENTPPIITLIGDANITITEGDVYTDEGATAADAEDDDITANIIDNANVVDTNTPGIYEITYNVSDSDGAAATEVTRTVTVEAIVVEPACNDGLDNDDDELIDMEDLGCVDAEDDDEANSAPGTATLTVIKNMINDNAGTSTASDFMLQISGLLSEIFAGSETGTVFNFETFGDYTISEGAYTGYMTTYSDDCVGALISGDSKTCTVTNDDISDTVTICHVVGDNTYNVQTPNASATINQGHGSHEGDIIPPFPYGDTSYPGLNWNEEGQAIWNNDCVVPPPPTTGTLVVEKDVRDAQGEDVQDVTAFMFMLASEESESTATYSFSEELPYNFVELTPGNYTVSELTDDMPIGYTFVSISEDDMIGDGVVSIIAGETVTVTITNKQDAQNPEDMACSLVADDTTVRSGSDVELTWTTENATDVSINEIGNVDVSGSTTFEINDDTTFVLTARNTKTEQEVTCTVTVEETRRSGGGSNRSSSNNAGEVLGAFTGDTSCTPYITSYMRLGANNNREEVMKLQAFLNEQGYTIPVNGTFGAITDSAVRAFQKTHSAEILAPWGITEPTGYAYKFTRYVMNNMVCPGSEAKPTL